MKHHRFITWIITSSLFLVFLGRLHIILTRYFDPDEFAHLHWTYLLVHGALPYRDIFMFHIPVFQWFLAPLFFLSESASTLILARIIQFVLYITIAFFIFLLTKRITKNNTISLLSSLLFLIFPITFDKSIEIRPDLLMMALYIICIYLVAFHKNKLFLSGLLLGFSLLVFPKMIFAVPSIVLLLIKDTHISSYKKIAKHFIAGFSLPFFLFLLYLFMNGITKNALTAFMQTSVIAYSGKPRFSPLVALSPSPLVYVGTGGISFPWIINTIIFATGLLGLIPLYRLNKKIFHAFISYLIFGGIFLFAFPSPYIQYFMPLSMVLSILSALCITSMVHSFPFIVRTMGMTIVTGALVLSFWQQYRLRVDSGSNNLEQVQVITDIIRISKQTETFYDVVGSYVFRPDGYVICCHPYGEFIDRMNPRPISLAQSLVEKQTKFLIMDRTGLLFWLPREDDIRFLLQNYVASDYRKIYTVGQQFTCVQSVCTQANGGKPPPVTNTLSIVIPETYRVSLKPESSYIMVDGHKRTNGEILSLQARTYAYTVPPTVTYILLKLAR